MDGLWRRVELEDLSIDVLAYASEKSVVYG